MNEPSRGPSTTPLGALRALAALRRGIALYPSGHVIIDQNATHLEREVIRVIDEYGRFRVEVVVGTAHLDGYPFRLESQANQGIIGELVRAGVDCIQIDPGVDRAELVRAAELLNDLLEGRVRPSGLGQALDDRDIRSVTFTRLLPIGDRRGGGHQWPSAPAEIHDSSYREVLGVAEDVLETIFAGTTELNVGKVKNLRDAVMAMIAGGTDPFREIMAVKQYENYTYCHSVNVASLSVLLGRRVGLDDATIEMLAEGALLHDVGKRGVPVEILNKAGPLDQREWRVIKRHPVLGAEILAAAGGFSRVTPTIALEHHREFGGGGYPDLGELSPHPISQIVAVADTYEALTGARSYRDPLCPDEACLILARMAGRKLNPALVRAFVSMITFFPVGCVVRLSTGEVGVVVETRESEPLHPIIAVVTEEASDATAQSRIDTASRDEAGAYLRHVVETLPTSPPRVEAVGERGSPRRKASPSVTTAS